MRAGRAAKNVLSWILFFACLTISVAWIWSYVSSDEFTYRTQPDTMYEIRSAGGSVGVGRTKEVKSRPGDSRVEIVSTAHTPASRWNRLGFYYVHENSNYTYFTASRTVVAIPYWLLLGFMLALLFLNVRDRIRDRQRELTEQKCRKCGYDLRATPDRCPECGTAARPA